MNADQPPSCFSSNGFEPCRGRAQHISQTKLQTGRTFSNIVRRRCLLLRLNWDPLPGPVMSDLGIWANPPTSHVLGRPKPNKSVQSVGSTHQSNHGVGRRLSQFVFPGWIPAGFLSDVDIRAPRLVTCRSLHNLHQASPSLQRSPTKLVEIVFRAYLHLPFELRPKWRSTQEGSNAPSAKSNRKPPAFSSRGDWVFTFKTEKPPRQQRHELQRLSRYQVIVCGEGDCLGPCKNLSSGQPGQSDSKGKSCPKLGIHLQL